MARSIKPPRRDGGASPLERPPAEQIDARRVVIVGSLLWLVGFLVLLPFWGWLGDHGHRVWLWTCLAGAVLGCVGYALMAKHRREGRAP